MTTGGKLPTTPIYVVVDKHRPLPNFLVDRTNPYTWTFFIFSTAEKAAACAGRLMKHDPKLRLDFSVVHNEEVFRGILVALSELCTKLKWVHQDPTDARRSPKRWEVKNLLNARAKGA